MESNAIVKNKKGEVVVLGHDAWHGFKKVFGIVFALGCIYLGVVMYFSLQHLPSGH